MEHFVRQPDGQWLFSEAGGLDASVELPSIQCTLALAEVYHKVETGSGDQAAAT